MKSPPKKLRGAGLLVTWPHSRVPLGRWITSLNTSPPNCAQLPQRSAFASRAFELKRRSKAHSFGFDIQRSDSERSFVVEIGKADVEAKTHPTERRKPAHFGAGISCFL